MGTCLDGIISDLKLFFGDNKKKSFCVDKKDKI